MIDQQIVDDVTVVTMRNGENRFNLDFATALADAIDEAAARAKPLVLAGDGKFFSNGLDLDWMRSAGSSEVGIMFPTLYRTLARVLSFPGATVAAINGHAFGAGLILATAADQRVMRSDRGFFCFPEVDLGMAMSDEFDAVIKAKLPAEALFRALISGHRYAGPEAVEAGLVHEVAAEDELVGRAVAMAGALADKDGATIGKIKAKHFEDVVAVLLGAQG